MNHAWFRRHFDNLNPESALMSHFGNDVCSRMAGSMVLVLDVTLLNFMSPIIGLGVVVSESKNPGLVAMLRVPKGERLAGFLRQSASR